MTGTTLRRWVLVFLARSLLACLPAARVGQAADLFVTNTNDSGDGSLRQAILDSNASAGVPDTIRFDIPGGGVHSIAPGSPLPTITDPVVVDGTTQPGFAGTPLVELDGSGAGGGSGLRISAGGSTVRGLAINRFPAYGIQLENKPGNVIEGNFVGTDPTGAIDLGNGGHGIFLESNANTIGGTTVASRNVLSGNTLAGIGINASNNVVSGNFIGTNAAGAAALPNSGGGIVTTGTGNVFGGTAAGAGNLISGNTGAGMQLLTGGHLVQGNRIGTDVTGSAALGNANDGIFTNGGSTIGGTDKGAGNVISGNGRHGIQTRSNGFIQGNFIGTDAAGSAALPNQANGIQINGASNVTIGGTAAAAGNVLSGNAGHGIEIRSGSSSNVVYGNFIGTDSTGAAALGNALDGVALSTSSSNTIGGTGAAGEANQIAFNAGAGVRVFSGAANLVSGNSIHDNGELGIDLGPAGETPNDAGDGDSGANLLQNHPFVTQFSAAGGGTTIQGFLKSTPNASFTLEFYRNNSCDGSGYGEGEQYLGSAAVATNGTGDATITETFPVSVSSTESVGVTATDAVGNTSEFSLCAPVEAVALAADTSSGAGSDGNGVFEPGETAVVAPSWMNPTAGALGFDGAVSSLSGPAGPSYSITDVAAAYGSVPALGTHDCLPSPGCYSMFVSDPGSRPEARPVAHWDATFTETLDLPLTPPKVWKLHLGDSFTDVPRSYLFYNRIETVFHNLITVGCTTTTYCPTDKVPRSQMAIFIARGLAGGGANVPSSGAWNGNNYNCVAGGVSLFSDVAPTDIFCKSVHHIAVQNVTAGCSPGLYCPAGLVSRAAMAGFIARALVAPGGGGAVPLTYMDPVTTFSYSCDAASPNLHFTDVAVSDPFCKHIHFLWARGVIAGCGGSLYCPAGEVARDEMAKFLANAFKLLLYGP